MEPSTTSNPLLSLSAFIHRHWLRLHTDLSFRLAESTRHLVPPRPLPPFASVSSQPKRGLSSNHVAKTLVGTAVYTVSNSDNEFVLASDADGVKSIGLLCFRREDAEAFLHQARLRNRELQIGGKVVPITLDQVYMLKIEGIAFRFLPDPLQIKNAVELKDAKSGFDGVPIFQSDLLVVQKKNKRYCPIYFKKEDIERELLKVSRVSQGSTLSQHIMVGSLEDVLKKMEMNEKDFGWEDLIFIPPGKRHLQHIEEVAQG